MFTERRGLRSLRTSPKQLDKPEFERLYSPLKRTCCKYSQQVLKLHKHLRPADVGAIIVSRET